MALGVILGPFLFKDTLRVTLACGIFLIPAHRPISLLLFWTFWPTANHSKYQIFVPMTQRVMTAILELWCKGSFIFSGEDKTKEVTGKKAFSFYEFTPWHFDFSFFARLFENFLKLSLRTERVFAPKKGEAHG